MHRPALSVAAGPRGRVRGIGDCSGERSGITLVFIVREDALAERQWRPINLVPLAFGLSDLRPVNLWHFVPDGPMTVEPEDLCYKS
jgi:hypothetical protein